MLSGEYGFHAKFSLNEIRKNEWMKMTKFCFKFLRTFDEILKLIFFDKNRIFFILHLEDCEISDKVSDVIK